ncbi:MAG: hypothetical protein IKN12_09935 [Selenomonadaceae bacterium]|nr:hypothetical protein [Selenomonadaceae bacterium]
MSENTMNPEKALRLLSYLQTDFLQIMNEAEENNLYQLAEEYYKLMNYLFWLVLALAPKDVADKYVKEETL